MKKKISFLLLAMLLVSCAEKLVEQPEDLIPKDKMTNMLYDIAILTAGKNTSRATLVDRGIKTMDYIYKKYKIDSVQFVKSDLYYASRPAEYEAIYTEVETRLTDEKNRIQDARMQENDSIAEALKKSSKKE